MSEMIDTPKLGMFVRALRMGFSWTGHSFLRISGDGPFKLEFYPMELIPNSAANGGLHWVWWSKEAAISRDAWFFQVKAKRHFITYINDEGEVL